MVERRSPKPKVAGSTPAWPVNIEIKMFGKIKNFFSEVIVELKKVSWSTRQEVLDSTWVILISSAILGVFIAVTDFTLSKLVAFIIR